MARILARGNHVRRLAQPAARARRRSARCMRAWRVATRRAASTSAKHCPTTCSPTTPRRCTTWRWGCGRVTEEGRWNYDVALFYMRRYDQQVPTGVQLVPGDPLTFVQYTDNAAGGRNYGCRKHAGLAADGLTTRGPARLALLETAYLDYAIGRSRPGRTRAGARTAVPVRPGIRLAKCRVLRRAWTSPGVDDFYFDDSHDERARARVLTNLKAGLSGKHWRAEVWVRNLFDEYYSQRGFWFGNEPPDFSPKRYVQAGDPRHFGLTIEYQFR